MGNFGEDLRMERLSRGIALEYITSVTKISQRHLLALEQERFRLLPGGILSKGIVRGYAGAVGLDQHDWTERFLKASKAAGQASDDDRGWAAFADERRQGPHPAPRRHRDSPALGRRHPASALGLRCRLSDGALLWPARRLVAHAASHARRLRAPSTMCSRWFQALICTPDRRGSITKFPPRSQIAVSAIPTVDALRFDLGTTPLNPHWSPFTASLCSRPPGRLH